MKKLFSFMIVLAVLVSAGSLLAYGTASGTWLTNAKSGASTDPTVATNAGELSASFSNAAGSVYNASLLATDIVTKVTQGYDLSPVLVADPLDQTGNAGSYVTFTAYLTNWGNGTAPIGSMVTNLEVSDYTPGWTNAFSIYIDGIGMSSNNNAPEGGVETAAGNFITVLLRVWIPETMPDGATNRFEYRFGHDQNGIPVVLPDSWPGINAIAPATDDTANLRDYQSVSGVVRVSALPVITLSKSVDLTEIRPFEDITYTIGYTNSGTVAAMGVRIQDVLDGTKFTTPFALEINHNGLGWAAAGADGNSASVGDGSKVVAEFTPNGGVVGVGEFGFVRFTVRVK